MDSRHFAGDMLVSVDQLAEQLSQKAAEGSMVIVDCRFDLLKPQAGRRSYERGHIPGARYADLDRDLAGPVTAESGRHPLPDPEHFAALLGSWGVGPETSVVAYDASGGAVAARLWWLLRWVGHTKVALLDGGFGAWADDKLPLETEPPAARAGRYPVRPGSMPVVSIHDVLAGTEDGSLALVDARDRKRFNGEIEPIDTRAGHIPGSLNRPFQANLDALGNFRASADLLESFALLPVSDNQRVACMCGSGVTACHNIFALELAGAQLGSTATPALYTGSWSEWIRSDVRPIATCVPTD
ncbi:MAG: sulfurtransferase [Gammaproteobacteria bacterium]